MAHSVTQRRAHSDEQIDVATRLETASHGRTIKMHCQQFVAQTLPQQSESIGYLGVHLVSALTWFRDILPAFGFVE
jgi:hypothetical protein